MNLNDIIEKYALKHGETIASKEIFPQRIVAHMESGKIIEATTTYKTEKLSYTYINEIVDGKRKRISKSEW